MASHSAQAPSDYVTLGRVGKSYGIKGWFKVISFTEPPAKLFDYLPWHLKHHQQWQVVGLEAHRAHAGGFIAKLQGCETPEEARLYTNRDIGIPRDQLPHTQNDEHYWCDLIGLEVYTLEGILLGQVQEVLATGSNEVLRIQGERERMIPYIDSVIQNVNLEQHRLIVDWDPEF